MNEEFLNFLDELMKANPTLTEQLKTDNVSAYIEALKTGTVSSKPTMTKNGQAVLSYLKAITIPMKSADIATGMGIAARSVSGTLRKLSTDGYVEKIAVAGTSAVYLITDKGKKFNID